MAFEWKKRALSDLGEIVGGATPSTKDESNYGGTIPWITPKDLSTLKGRFISYGERNITEKGLHSCSTQMMPANSVLFSSRAPIGYIAIAANPVCTNQGFKSIVVNDNNDPMFIYYLLKYNKDTIEAMGSGTTFKEVSGNTMRNVRVRVPVTKIDQLRVASVLSALDDKIELNNKINNNLFEQSLALFDTMFGNTASGDGHIGEYITPKRGKTLLSKDAIEGEVPVVAGGLEPSTYHNIANTVAPVLAISASGANAGYVSFWNIPIWSSDSSYIDSSMTDVVYFWYVLLKKRQNEVFEAQTGSAQPHIYPQHIAAMPVINLDMAKAHIFNSTVTPFFEVIGENILQNSKLSNIRNAILPKLMSGKLDVSNIEI